MNCFYFTSDLMFTSRVKPVAQEMGVLLKFPGFEQVDFDSKPDLVIFDLEFVSKDELKALMEKFASVWGDDLPRIVAYGPHVKEARLQNARDCGVQEVVTRGQFNKGFAAYFTNA